MDGIVRNNGSEMCNKRNVFHSFTESESEWERKASDTQLNKPIMYATTGCYYFGANTVAWIALCFVIKSALIMTALEREASARVALSA